MSSRSGSIHNLRKIARETSIASHINPERTRLNLVLEGNDDPLAMCRAAVSTVKQATGKKLRANGVFAVEIVFSLPVTAKEVPSSFFEESLDWLRDYWSCPIISAVVHLDEANPHMHVVVLPLRQGKMNGAAIVGFKPEFAAFKKNHHTEVAGRYGFNLVEAVPKYRRIAAAKEIVGCLQMHPQWLNHPSIVDALMGAIATRPGELLSVLGLDPELG